MPRLTRRRFFQALAASALALGVPLPTGFPEQPVTATEAKQRLQEANARWGLHAKVNGWHFYAKRGGTKILQSRHAPNTSQETILTHIQHSGTTA